MGVGGVNGLEVETSQKELQLETAAREEAMSPEEKAWRYAREHALVHRPLPALHRRHARLARLADLRSEASRFVVRGYDRELGRVEEIDMLPLADARAAEIQEQITAAITALWQTEEVRRKAP